MMTLHPWWWIVALCALLPWIGPWRGRDAGQNALRSQLFVFLAAPLTRPHLLRDDAAPQRILILDRSASVDPEASPRSRKGMATSLTRRRAWFPDRQRISG